MNFRIFIIAAVYFGFNFTPPPTLADTVYLKNGKTLAVEKSWQEADQVWFVFRSMKASIPLSKVVRVEKGSDPAKRGTPENRSSAANNGVPPSLLENMLPNKILKTAGTSTNSQLLSPSTKKPLVLLKDGLADMRWGSRLNTVRGLEIKDTDSGLKEVIEYVRPSDPLKLGEAALKAVVYAFWRDQFYTVSIWTQGPENYKALCDAAFNLFGKGTRIGDSNEKYLWSDSNTDVMLQYASDSQYGLLWMRGNALDRKFKLSKLNGHTSYLKQLKSIK